LKCSVTFAFDRYFVNRGGGIQEANDTVNPTVPLQNPSASGPSDTQATKGSDAFKKEKVGDITKDPDALKAIQEERDLISAQNERREAADARALQRGDSIPTSGGGSFSMDFL